MSPREQIQAQIVGWLNAHKDKFNAPYGVLPSLDPIKNGKGKVRTVTFGQARWLDATVFIWSPNHLTVQAAGPASVRFGYLTQFNNVNDVLTALDDL